MPGEDFKVHAPTTDVPVSGTDVVEIESQKQTFWRQLKGSIGFGYNFTSGNNQPSLSTSASAVYPAERWAVGTSYNTSFSGQAGGATTNLFESQTFADRFLNRNSFVLGLGDFLHSSQQNLSLRTTLGGGYGRYLKRSNQNSLRWLVGADYTKANYQAGLNQLTQNNVEVLLGTEYQLFHFDRYTLQSQFLLFPGMSDFGRIRFTTNDTFSIRLSNNFHLNFPFWDNFDSNPPLNAKKNAARFEHRPGLDVLMARLADARGSTHSFMAFLFAFFDKRRVYWFGHRTLPHSENQTGVYWRPFSGQIGNSDSTTWQRQGNNRNRRKEAI